MGRSERQEGAGAWAASGRWDKSFVPPAVHVASHVLRAVLRTEVALGSQKIL